MPTYTKKGTTGTTKTTASTGSKWNDNITGEMTVHINTFGEGSKAVTKYSTRLYRKMEDGDYVNHYIDVAFIPGKDSGLTRPTADLKKVKINVENAFISLDYWVNKETGEIGYKPVIYVKKWSVSA